MTDSAAFDHYRRLPTERTTLFRMIVGVVVVAACWFGLTFGVIFGGSYVWAGSVGDGFYGFGDAVQQFMGSAGGLFATLFSFAGIWLGLWIVMPLLHRERLSRLFGNSGRIQKSGFLRGLVAVLLTSLLTELAYLSIIPDISRGSIEFGTWMLLVIPIIVFAFVQTSSEELLFRGYLQRGLAYRFRSPIAWAVVPTLAFTVLHWNPQSVLAMNIGVFISIGAFAILLALLVYVTGNLAAAMGAHLGNNLMGFALISHDDTLGGLALFRAPPLDSLAWTPFETITIVAISIVSILLTWALLLHPRSPLRVDPDLAWQADNFPENLPEAAENLRQT